MISLLRTTSHHPDFIDLVKLLDAYLAITDGTEHSFYAQFNKIDTLKNVVIAFEHGVAVGCGAFKPFDTHAAEIKRMFVKEEARGKKVASKILTELENWANEIGFERTVLETGCRQTEAVAFYHKMGYGVISNYGQYIGVENSLCFEKTKQPQYSSK